MTEKNTGQTASYEELQDMVASTDTGGRHPHGFVRRLMVWVAILWSVFQIYYASPLPFMLQGWLHDLGWNGLNVVVDDTRARSIHLSFAMFLAFLSYPALRNSPRHYVPVTDWVFALTGAFLASYYIFFYSDLVGRIGAPNTQDIIAGCIGIVLLLEATRRSLGLPLVIIAVAFLLYNYFGQFLPVSSIISHKSGSLNQIVNQQWISTEGVFGTALGVSTKYVFLFVLFGALLDKAGAGNYFIKTAFAYLGHLRGGPAKAAVVASGLTGLISGSSIANVVTTGTFTIPMMKRVGFPAEKAGAVEVASSVNGQIMPPVMGAAAFLMVEYVGMPYSQLITHAFLPAVICYIALVYIVHLEACKAGMSGLPRTDLPNPVWISILRALTVFIVLCLMYFALRRGLGWLKNYFPDGAVFVVCALLLAAYVALVYRVSQFPDLVADDPGEEITRLPSVRPTVNSGLHYLLPVAVLIWFLMVEMKSPGLSAFWGTMALMFIQLTQRPLLAFFRRQGNYRAGFRQGVLELKDGLETGARNMIGIGIATACAGIIVGVVALTGFGIQLSAIIEQISGGNLIIMLVLVAVFSLILGMGLPTTANYIVVSSLMAVVIVEVGQQNGLVVPLIAVHLFVFFFGIMADVTPPVGLASFAAAAISGGDPIKTGLVAFWYSLRTALLPFFFIFNTDLLLINVGFAQGVLIFAVATFAMLVFTAATMGWFMARNRLWETLALLLATFVLFRPGFFMDFVSPAQEHVPIAELADKLGAAKAGDSLMLHVKGEDAFGKPRAFYVRLPVPDGQDGEARLDALGLILLDAGGTFGHDGETYPDWQIDAVTFDSAAEKAGLEFGQQLIGAALPNPSALRKEWMFVPGILLVLLIAWVQRLRVAKHSTEKGGIHV